MNFKITRISSNKSRPFYGNFQYINLISFSTLKKNEKEFPLSKLKMKIDEVEENVKVSIRCRPLLDIEKDDVCVKVKIISLYLVHFVKLSNILNVQQIFGNLFISFIFFLSCLSLSFHISLLKVEANFRQLN